MYNFLNNLFVQYVLEACGFDKSYLEFKKKIGEFLLFWQSQYVNCEWISKLRKYKDDWMSTGPVSRGNSNK